jgi:cytochrome c oxidase subunit 2
MGTGANPHPRRVLIASANPLFGEGLRRLFRDRWGKQATVVGLTSDMTSTLKALEELHPDLVIVDYDDSTINRAEFLNHFVADERPMRVMLISLSQTGAVVVYDRRSLTASEAEDWLSFSSLLDDDADPQRPEES